MLRRFRIKKENETVMGVIINPDDKTNVEVDNVINRISNGEDADTVLTEFQDKWMHDNNTPTQQ